MFLATVIAGLGFCAKAMTRRPEGLTQRSPGNPAAPGATGSCYPPAAELKMGRNLTNVMPPQHCNLSKHVRLD